MMYNNSGVTMKNSNVKSFLLRLLTLIILLLILNYLNRTITQADSNRSPTNNNSNEKHQFNNTVETPTLNESKKNFENEESGVKNQNYQLVNNEKENIKLTNAPSPIKTNVEPKKNYDAPKVDVPITKVKNIYNLKIDECAAFDYSKYVKKYQLTNDFRYLLQAYCENSQKSTIDAYTLLKQLFQKIENTSLITQKTVTLKLIEQFKSDWNQIVRE